MISTQRSTEAEEMYKKNEWMIAEKKDNYIIALLHYCTSMQQQKRRIRTATMQEIKNHGG